MGEGIVVMRVLDVGVVAGVVVGGGGGGAVGVEVELRFGVLKLSSVKAHIP